MTEWVVSNPELERKEKKKKKGEAECNNLNL